MAKLELIDAGINVLTLRFTSGPLASNYITVSWFKIADDESSEFVGSFDKDIEVGIDIDFTFGIDGLDSGTDYLVYVFDAQENLLADEVYTTLGDKPIFKSPFVKAENGKIKVAFSVSNVNTEKVGNVYGWGSYIWLRINGTTVGRWDGDDVSDIIAMSDQTGNVIERGTFTFSGEFDFPDGDSCTVRLEATNVCDNVVTGSTVYEETSYREFVISLPFLWDIPKTSGQPIRLSASEWNKFTKKVNEWLRAKGKSTVSFTVAVSAGMPIGAVVGGNHNLEKGKVISAEIINEAVTALKSIGAGVDEVGKNERLSAEFFNDIVDKMNNL